MGMTVAQKILARAIGRESVEVGEMIWATPDLAIGHDLNYPRYRDMMDKMGIGKVAMPERLMLTIDHLPYASDSVSARTHARMRRDAKEEKFSHFFDLGRGGISHNLPIEHGLVTPGMLVITSDTRSPALGCVGAMGVALGAGFLTVMVTGKAWLRVPATIRIELTGKPQRGVMSRDLGEWVAHQIGPERGDYKSIEFSGPAFRHLEIDARHTICNAMVDIGVKCAFVIPDEITEAYVQKFGKAFEPVLPDQNAIYEETVTLDVSALEPQIAMPPDPENVHPISAAVGRKINVAYVGSCISGKIEDLRAAASILKGRKVHESVRFIVIPATHSIYEKAVAEGLMKTFAEANCYVAVGACGPCYGTLAPLSDNEVCIGTGTRNEPGRMGSHSAVVMIANAATVAASAVRGEVTDPRELMELA